MRRCRGRSPLSIDLLEAGGAAVVVRLRVVNLRTTGWLPRLEQLSPAELAGALGGEPLELAAEARLTVLPAQDESRASIVFATLRR